MNSLTSLILIPAVLLASVLPACVYAAPTEPDTQATTSEPPDESAAPATEDHQDGDSSDRQDQSNDREKSTTTAPPPLALTPRTNSVEALERSMRAPVEGKAVVRIEFSLSWRDRAHHKPARLDQVMSRARCVATALRFVASRLRSHAPPVR